MEIIETLTPLLKSESDSVRKATIDLLMALRRREAIPLLIDALDHEPRMMICHKLAEVLGEVGDNRAIPVLEKTGKRVWGGMSSGIYCAQHLRPAVDLAIAKIQHRATYTA